MKKILYLFLFLQVGLLSFLIGGPEEENLSANDTINGFLDAAKEKNYERMLGFMSPHFKDCISEDFYYETMKTKDFVLDESDILSEKIFKEGGYYFGELRYRTTGRKILTWKGIFVSKINDEWKIDSFPFTKVGIPEFIEIPKGLSEGIYHYND